MVDMPAKFPCPLHVFLTKFNLPVTAFKTRLDFAAILLLTIPGTWHTAARDFQMFL